MIYTSFAPDRLNEDIAPFPELLDQEWKVSKLNEHTAQSPLLTEEPSSFYNQQNIETLLFYRLDYREYIFGTLLLLGFYYPTENQFRGYLTIKWDCCRASGVTTSTTHRLLQLRRGHRGPLPHLLRGDHSRGVSNSTEDHQLLQGDPKASSTQAF